MSSPRLAICIPAYNQPEFLRDALTSLCDQDLDPDQFVVAISDDASPTPLDDVIDAFRSRLPIRFHRHERNLGHLANWDAAWQMVDTPFISFLAHDDVVAPGHLARALAAIEGDVDTVLVASLIVCQSHPGALNTHPHGLLLRGSSATSFTKPYRWDRAEWMALGLVTTPNSVIGSVFRTDAFRKCRLWHSYPIWHDRLMLAEMGVHGAVVTLPWIAGQYRTGEWQLSGQLWQPDMNEFKRASQAVLAACDANGIAVLAFWIDHICAATDSQRIVFLQMLRGALEPRQFADIKTQCEARLGKRLTLSRLERLGVPEPIAQLVRTIDRRLMRRDP
jgi:glycosyltransferase involved in cell wall biosynthesis